MNARASSLLIAFLFAPACFASEGETTTTAAAITLALKPEAISVGEQVFLEEVAAVAGLSEEKRVALKTASVGRAARAGQNRSFTRQEVLAALRKIGCADAVEFQGAPNVTVTAAVERVDAKKFSDAAAAAVRTYFEKDPDLEVEIEITSVPADLQLRPGGINLDVELPDSGPRPGSQSIKVFVQQAGRRVAEPVVGVKVRVNGSVEVAAERLQVGDILADASIKTMRKDLNANDFINRSSASRLIGMRARKLINIEETLNKSMFAMPQVIKRGEVVTVLVKRGALELATRGEARNDAALDEAVHVLIVDSGADVTARASGTREVTLDDTVSRRK